MTELPYFFVIVAIETHHLSSSD